MFPVQDHFSPIFSQYLTRAFQPNNPSHSVVVTSLSGIRNEKKPLNLCFTMVLLRICWTVFYPPLIMGLFFCSSLHSYRQKMGIIQSHLPFLWSRTPYHRPCIHLLLSSNTPDRKKPVRTSTPDVGIPVWPPFIWSLASSYPAPEPPSSNVQESWLQWPSSWGGNLDKD